MSITRRNFLSALPASIASYYIHGPQRYPTYIQAEASADRANGTLPERSLSGVNLSNWLVTLGDSVYPLDGDNRVTNDDIVTNHQANRSEMLANINNRLIKAHNITYFPIADETALSYEHECGFEFRIPYEPQGNLEGDFNGHTFDAGLFIWDGNVTRLDYGASFQWIISPFDFQNYGNLQVWSTAESFLGSWVNTGFKLDVDTEWHTFYVKINFTNQRVTMQVDDITLPAPFTAISKSIDWTTGIGARLQAEIIGLFPGPEAIFPFPAHKCQVRNWYWNWLNPTKDLFLPFVPKGG